MGQKRTAGMQESAHGINFADGGMGKWKSHRATELVFSVTPSVTPSFVCSSLHSFLRPVFRRWRGMVQHAVSVIIPVMNTPHWTVQIEWWLTTRGRGYKKGSRSLPHRPPPQHPLPPLTCLALHHLRPNGMPEVVAIAVGALRAWGCLEGGESGATRRDEECVFCDVGCVRNWRWDW